MPSQAGLQGFSYVLLAASLTTVASLVIRRRKYRKPPAPLPEDFPVTPAKVLAAAARVAPHVHATPLAYCASLDVKAGVQTRERCGLGARRGSVRRSSNFGRKRPRRGRAAGAPREDDARRETSRLDARRRLRGGRVRRGSVRHSGRRRPRPYRETGE